MSATVVSNRPGSIQVRMPAGTYRLGDPCYSVPEDRWMEWLDAADYTHADGFLLAYIDGYPVLGFHTAYGDGVYLGSDGNGYAVDAGLIGLVPVQVADCRMQGTSPELYQIVTFVEPTVCERAGNGILYFGDVVIDTVQEDE